METDKKPPPEGAYPRLWRWHFFSGLFLSPTLATLAVTGLVYLFKPQLEPRLYERWLKVPAAERTESAQTQLDNALAAFPEAKVQYVIASPGPGEAAQVFLKTQQGVPVTVYVDPHTGTVAGSQRSDRTLMALAHDIHGSLLLGKPGEIVMELTAGWAFILIASGLFLWWPRSRAGGGGVFWPRLSLKGRALWRDFHAVPAFYLSALILLFLLTGLAWTSVTGKLLSNLGRATGTGSPPGFGSSPFRSTPAPGQKPAPLDVLVAVARERLPDAKPHIIPSKDGLSAAVIRWKAPRPQDRAYIHVDAYSGQVLADYRWKDFGVIGKFTLMSVALHEGTWFGVWNQILNSVIALGVLGLSLTGLVLWWKRRPPGAGLAAPKAAEGSRLPAGFVWLTVLFGLMVPVTGISLLAVLAAEAAVRRVISWRQKTC